MKKVVTFLRDREEKLMGSRECPEYDGSGPVCQAAIGYMVPSRQQQMHYCSSCDYDNCPVYLGKALRTSRPQGADRESLLASGK